MTGDIGKGSPWRGGRGRGGGGRPTVRCLYERAVRTTCQERQTERERETEDKRGSVSPTLAPRPHPPPGLALDVQAAFCQGAHSAKLGYSLKPSGLPPATATHSKEPAPHSQPLCSTHPGTACPNHRAPTQAKHTQGQTLRPAKGCFGGGRSCKENPDRENGCRLQSQLTLHAPQPSGRA